VEIKTEKIKVEKTERRRRKKAREKRKEEEETKKEENNGNKKVVEEWEIWDKEKEAKKLVPPRFHK